MIVIWFKARSHCRVEDKPLALYTRDRGFETWLLQSDVRDFLKVVAPSPYDLSCWWDVKFKHRNSSKITEIVLNVCFIPLLYRLFFFILTSFSIIR